MSVHLIENTNDIEEIYILDLNENAFEEPDYDMDQQEWLAYALENEYDDLCQHTTSLILREEHLEREFGIHVR